MGDAVELAFRRAAVRLIDPRKRWLVAVSGGADSMALLHLLVRFLRGRGELNVAHLDHGLRAESRVDRRFVETRAAGLGLTVRAERMDVEAARRRDESPEEAARRVRRSFLLQARREAKADGIVTGHTLDDQAETVIMRLARGAGAAALSGIAETSGVFVRPLLDLEHAALRRWLERRGLSWIEDPSNHDLRFDRNRVRRLVVPLLQEALNPRAARHLALAARGLRADAEFLDAMAEERFEALSRIDLAGRPVLDARALLELPAVISRRVALAAFRHAGLDVRRIGRKHVEALLDLAAPPSGRQIHLPGKRRARRAGGEIRFDAG